MYFLKSGEDKEKNRIGIIIVTIFFLIVILIVGFCFREQKKMNEKDGGYEETVEETDENSRDIVEEIELLEETKEEIVEVWSQEELNEMLVAIQKQYIFQKWYENEESIYNMPDSLEKDRVSISSGDLEEVIFYQDKNGVIYFIPTKMVNKQVVWENREFEVRECNVDGASGYYLYSCEFFETDWKRIIYPEPDDQYIYISCSKNMQDKLKDLYKLGIGRAAFPEIVPDEAFALYENEYTDAVVDIIHSYLYDMEEYGEYQIYIGRYGINLDKGNVERGYNIGITVAIVPIDKEIGYSQWWTFRAKDVLDDNGKVIVETDGGENHSHPGRYDNYERSAKIYGPMIEGIINANRLLIPLTVKEDDQTKPLEGFKDDDDLNIIHFHLRKL